MNSPQVTPHAGVPRFIAVSVLLIEDRPEAARLVERTLEAHLSNLVFVQAVDVDGARKAVRASRPDLIILRYGLRTAPCDSILALASEQDDDVVPVLAYAPENDRDVAEVRRLHPGLLDCVVEEGEAAHLRRTPVQYLRAVARIKQRVYEQPAPRMTDLLRRIRHTLSRVNHDLNNPLSIISGNAQLLGEISRALDLDGDLAQPIQDIEEASVRMAGIARRLVDLRDQLPVDDDTASDVRAELRNLQAERNGSR